jgi:hypothetical protein
MAIDDVITYVSRFDPRFAQRIEGANAEDVSRLERLVHSLTGKQAPPDYLEYMLRLGLNDGGLRPIAQYASLGIYEDMERDGDTKDDFAPDCILIAYTGVALPDVSLEILDGSETPPRAVFTSDSEILNEEAESLHNMLHHAAFSTFRLQKLPFRAAFRPRDSKASLPDLVEAAIEAGVLKEEFSDRDVFCGTRGNTCVGMEYLASQSPHIRFSSTASTGIDDLVAEFRGDTALSLIT